MRRASYRGDVTLTRSSEMGFGSVWVSATKKEIHQGQFEDRNRETHFSFVLGLVEVLTNRYKSDTEKEVSVHFYSGTQTFY